MTLAPTERAVLAEVARGIPDGPRPYLTIARRSGVSEAECLDVIRSLLERGVIRRVAAVVHDRVLGYAGNAMVAWRVPPEGLEAAGAAAASRPEVSHAYARATTPAWPYNMYTMIHARTRDEALAVVEELGRAIGATGPVGSDDRRVLFSLREFTKRRPDYSAVLGESEDDSSTGGSDA